MKGSCLTSCLISGPCLTSGSCLICFELGGSARAFLHAAQKRFSLPKGRRCTPHSCLSAFREGRASTPRNYFSACREGRGCTPRSRSSPFRAGKGCSPCSGISPCREDTGYTPCRRISVSCEGSLCTPHSSVSPCRADTGYNPSSGVSAFRASIALILSLQVSHRETRASSVRVHAKTGVVALTSAFTRSPKSRTDQNAKAPPK